MRTFTINANDAGQRMDKFITKAVPKLPASLLYKYLRTKRIKCNGKRCEISTRLAEGDLVELYINDEFFEEQNALPHPFLAAKGTVDLLYEDDNILIANKPAGLLVHEDSQEQADTLIHRIQRYLYDKGEYRPEEEASFAPALCNRIDRNTSGIVLAAKTAPALRVLNEKIKTRQLQKLYLCLVHGTPSPKEATLTGYLVKDAAGNQVSVSRERTAGSRTILTRYRVLETRGRFSLVEVDLLTGRTHQIRAHMASIGHPLLGDAKYGFNRDNRGTGFSHQALCAYQLTFDFTGEPTCLDYLNHRAFTVPRIEFVEAFRSGALNQ